MIIDEAQYDFNAYFLPYDKYGPPVNQPIYGPMNSIQNEKLYPEPIYIPKPTYTAVTPDGKTYIPPPPPLYQVPQNFTDYYSNVRQPFINPSYPKNHLDYNNKYVNQPHQQNYYASIGHPQITHHQNEWLKM